MFLRTKWEVGSLDLEVADYSANNSLGILQTNSDSALNRTIGHSQKASM